MKKESLLIIIIFIIILPIAQAIQFKCTESNATLSQDTKEISEGSSKKINNLGIGVMKAEETAAINRISASLLINAEKLSLTENVSKEFSLYSGTYTALLQNLSDSSAETAKIQIEGSTEDAEINEIVSIGSFKVFLFSKSEGTADIIVGTEEISLAGTQDIYQEITVDSQQFIIELFSATDEEALIKVHKCSSGAAEAITTPTIQNQTPNITSQENNQTPNETVETNTSITQINQSNSTEIKLSSSGENKKTIIRIVIIAIIIILILTLIIIFIYLLRKNKSTSMYQQLLRSSNSEMSQ